MRKILVIILVAALSFMLNSCASFFVSGRPDFIKVDGTQFELNGKPYYFIGANLWYGCYLGSTGKTGDRARLVRELDELKSLGITNLRILGASEESYIPISLKPAIQIKPEVYNENLLNGLDFLLSEMSKRNMHAVIYLNNYWEWSGGMAQYNDWANGGGGVVPDENNYGKFMDYSATFYQNETAKEMYLHYIYSLINRKNNITGEYYKDDPTIMSWELCNEPRPGRNAYWIDEFYRWIDLTAQFIHNVDHNHLVTTGSEGTIGCLQDSTRFLIAHGSKYIDYATFHLWPKNWDWFDAKNAAGTYPATVRKAVSYIDDHIRLARELNKPVVMEEFGLPRDGEKYNAGTPTTIRDRYFKLILGLTADSAAEGAPIAGANVWAWGGEGRGRNPDNKWRPGDPYTGDPPQEPQGLNSVFNSDTSTITVLKEYAGKMAELRNTVKIAKLKIALK